MDRLILASSSPRRRKLLSIAEIPFTVVPSDFDEDSVSIADPEELVRVLAICKAREVAGRAPGRWIVGADTSLDLESRVLGKPRDEADARQMLKEISGREHYVVTGVAVIDQESGKEVAAVERTRVWMAEASDEEIYDYAATGEPLDKAGSYAIQGLGERFVDRIEGCYFNVIGLPLCLLGKLLQEMDGLNEFPHWSCVGPEGRTCPRVL